jgi:hypothetical protein
MPYRVELYLEYFVPADGTSAANGKKRAFGMVPIFWAALRQASHCFPVILSMGSLEVPVNSGPKTSGLKLLRRPIRRSVMDWLTRFAARRKRQRGWEDVSVLRVCAATRPENRISYEVSVGRSSASQMSCQTT